MIRRMFVGRSPSRGRDADKPAWPKNNSRPNDRQASRSSVEKIAAHWRDESSGTDYLWEASCV